MVKEELRNKKYLNYLRFIKRLVQVLDSDLADKHMFVLMDIVH